MDIELEEIPNTPLQKMRTLIQACAEQASHPAFSDLLQTHVDSTLQELTDAFIVELKKVVPGSLKQAIIVGIISYFSTYMTIIAATPALASMTEMSEVLKTILYGAPSISSAMIMIYVGKLLDTTNAKTPLQLMRGSAIAGGIGLIMYSLLGDIPSIATFDINYIILFALFLLLGFSIPTFLLITNVLYWSPVADVGLTCSLVLGIGGLSLGASQLLLQTLLKDISLAIVYMVLTAILLAGGAVFTKFYVPSPYHQLRDLNVDHKTAKKAAKLLKQEKFPNIISEPYLKALMRTAFDFRVLAISGGYISTLGAVFSSLVRTNYLLENAHGLTLAKANLFTSLSAMLVTLTRVFVGRPIDKLDKAGGAYAHLLGSSSFIMTSLFLGIGRSKVNLALTMASCLMTSIGIGVASAATSRLLSFWSKPKNLAMSSYNIGIMTGITSTLGQCAMAVPFLQSVVVKGSDDKSAGYYNSFYLTAGLTLVSAILTMIANLNHHDTWSKLFSRRDNARVELVEVDASAISPTALSSPHTQSQPTASLLRD